MAPPDATRPARHRAGRRASVTRSSRRGRLVLLTLVTSLAAAVLLGVAVAVAVGGGAGSSTMTAGHQAPTAPADPPGRQHVVLAGAGEPGAAPDTAGTARGVLHAWDEERAAAYARGSVARLRDLYVGRAGRSDVRVLRSYLRRGYVVEDLRMQLLAVRVLDHAPGEWRLEVTDRLAGGVAVGYGDRVALPRDRASTRNVVLRRGADGRWRAAAVSR